MSRPEDILLSKLEQQARVKQEAIMNNIAQRLGRERVKEAPAHPFRGAPEFWNEYQLSFDERIQLFMENWRKVGAEVERVPDMQAALESIKDTIQKMEAHHILAWDQTEIRDFNLEEKCKGIHLTYWNSNEKDLLTIAAGTDIGIGVVDFAVAQTGTLVALSAPTKGRSVSLLPTAFIAIIKADCLKTRLGEVMKELNALKENGFMPAGVHFITGPSRSADIENDLTIGVHGPGIMYAIIVE